MEDKLIFDLDGRSFALETSEVYRVVEVERLSYLPGQGGVVTGVISLSGEPVTVVNARKAFSISGITPSAVATRKIVVVRKERMTIGLDIGTAPVTFAWNADLEGGEVDTTGERNTGDTVESGMVAMESEDKPASENAGPYISGTFRRGAIIVELIDWTALFNEAVKTLSSEGLRA